MAVCHCIVCTVSFCQDNHHLDPLLIKLAQTMNRMKTALGLQCNCSILWGRLTWYCLVWRLMRRGLGWACRSGETFLHTWIFLGWSLHIGNLNRSRLFNRLPLLLLFLTEKRSWRKVLPSEDFFPVFLVVKWINEEVKLVASTIIAQIRTGQWEICC